MPPPSSPLLAWLPPTTPSVADETAGAWAALVEAFVADWAASAGAPPADRALAVMQYVSPLNK